MGEVGIPVCPSKGLSTIEWGRATLCLLILRWENLSLTFGLDQQGLQGTPEQLISGQGSSCKTSLVPGVHLPFAEPKEVSSYHQGSHGRGSELGCTQGSIIREFYGQLMLIDVLMGPGIRRRNPTLQFL